MVFIYLIVYLCLFLNSYELIILFIFFIHIFSVLYLTVIRNKTLHTQLFIQLIPLFIFCCSLFLPFTFLYFYFIWT
jgi:hypothetical protein